MEMCARVVNDRRIVMRASTSRAQDARARGGRASASKASKLGRFPAQLAYDASEDASSGETHERFLFDVIARARAKGDVVEDALAAFASADASAEASAWRNTRNTRVLLIHKNENLYNAYACEIAAMTSTSRALCHGMFLCADGVDARNAAGLRAELVPLFVASDAETVLARVEESALTIDDSSFDVAFTHDCVARNARRMSSDDLRRAFRGFLTRRGASALDRSHRGRRDVVRPVVRFVVVEAAEAYVFGVVTYAPSSERSMATDWANKPRHSSVGTRYEIALACVNVATARAREKGNDTRQCAFVLDPCCGSGSMVCAAMMRGFACAGGDVSPGQALAARTNIGYFFDRARARAHGSGDGDFQPRAMPVIVERDALALGAFDDGYGRSERADAIVSNLPFGRRVAVGGGDGDGRGALGASASEYVPLLEAFRDRAKTHVFISGAPIGETMRDVGYKNVSEVALCRFGKSYMTVALGSEAKAPLEPCVMFTVNEAQSREAGKRAKKLQKAWTSSASVDERFANPRALRVTVDVSYEQDSARARRSVAKQLCECVGAAHANDDLALTYCAWRGAVAEEAREFFFSDRWECVRKDERDVDEAFAREDVIYMSPDAEDVLDEIDVSKVYVVGGIVDLATRGMRTSVQRAAHSGFRAVRLPIREFKPEHTHEVLNIDAVVKILAARNTGLSWNAVFDQELPKRQARERPKRENRARERERGET